MGEEGRVPGLGIADSKKEARFQKVAHATLREALIAGPDGVRYASIARRSGVSRAWLYKYFGKDSEELVRFAARTFGESFIELDRPFSPTDRDAWRAGVEAATRRALDDAVVLDWALRLWFRYRHAPGVLGDTIRGLEKRHIDKFVDDMPPQVRWDMGRARRFATVFASTRLGLYYQWLDPEIRKTHHPDRMVEEVMRLVDVWLGPKLSG